ncbi:MAG: alkaline phosphatase family protein [Pyrinomonadaceae bacterium]|nr:alkaline phosphatase family protein [Pyrinomonadaceae bacterium]
MNTVTKAMRDRPRRLLLCLDGVPHEVIRQARHRGLFDCFHEPSRLLSPFPTMTNVALSTMLNASAPAGYESLYFDSDAREMRGGISNYVGRRTPDKIPSSYMDTLDYQEPLHFEFLIYVLPERIWRTDFNRFRQRLNCHAVTSDFFAFLKSTDGLLHIRGQEALGIALAHLDWMLRDVVKDYGRDTEIVVFSDHGMNLVDNKRVPLRAHLRRCGYKFSRDLKGAPASHIAIPAFGLCGYAAIYCAHDEAAAKVADKLSELEGVDFSIHADGAAAVVKSARGEARILRKVRDGETFYSYQQSTGDPLDLQSLIERVQEMFDAENFASEEIWYEHTSEHTYPDVIANLYGALFCSRVRHTANVLVSFKDGYYYGAEGFDHFASRLCATHGNALAPSTTAFLMSTHRTFPATVRAKDANSLLCEN